MAKAMASARVRVRFRIMFNARSRVRFMVWFRVRDRTGAKAGASVSVRLGLGL